MSFSLKLTALTFLAVLIPVYWRHYGPGNFLWLSDLGLACTVAAFVLESPLLASMAAVGILALELAWTADFIAGGRLLGLAGYMFDACYPLYLRLLSLFHLAIPPAVLLMLWQWGYDARALPLQVLLTWAAFAGAYLLTEPAKNINWVFGWGTEPQAVMPALAWFGVMCVGVPVLVMLPTHFLLSWGFPAAGR
ncbi:membrane-associated protein [Desertibaculum subflavum]|uniref:membrane-associated protein n=1 Tax=Desertibaculum subflavum TaxID=2268458 RepID=UPI000E66D463